MARVAGIIDGREYWLTEGGAWVSGPLDATDFESQEAEKRVRIINANNRFLDRDERIEGVGIVESR
jgi:hypothetical protein